VLDAGIIFRVLTTADIQALIADTEATILELIAEAEDEATRPMYEQMRYHLGLDGHNGVSGKRLRPLLGLLAYQSLTGSYEAALPGAAAVELGHNFSLVHDDIEDHGAERRHRAALWTITGVPQAINTGDALFVLSRMALHRLTELGFSDAKVLALMRLYDQTCLALCEGQFIDIWTSEGHGRQSVELYFDMIGRKTATLIAGSVQAGAMLATDDVAVIEAYRAFGWALGIAFQLNDDLLGIWGEETATGKAPADLSEHKHTLPTLYALEHGGPEDRERLAELLDLEAPSVETVDEARRIIERSGARDYTREQARWYRDEAVRQLALTGAVDAVARERLEQIIVTAISA
jgi:geranylgeranyl diphosphate synthase, type I